MTTGKNKEQFRSWYFDNDMNADKTLMDLLSFYHLPFEMQLGVYLAYYDSLGLEIMVKSWWQSKNIFIYSVNKIFESSCYSNDEDKIFKTRNEAYKEAFKKADELINQQQN